MRLLRVRAADNITIRGLRTILCNKRTQRVDIVVAIQCHHIRWQCRAFINSIDRCNRFNHLVVKIHHRVLFIIWANVARIRGQCLARNV